MESTRNSLRPPVRPLFPEPLISRVRSSSVQKVPSKKPVAQKTPNIPVPAKKSINPLNIGIARLYSCIASHVFVKTRYAVVVALTGATFLSSYHVFTFTLADRYIEVDDEDFFAWSSRLDVKLSFVVSRSLLLLPAARLSELYDAKWMLFAAILVYGLTSLFIPAFVLVLRNKVCFLIAGLVHNLMRGVILPSSHVILARWAPPAERLVMGSLINSGFPFGVAAAEFVDAWLSTSIGWQYAYYLAALLSLIWLLSAGFVLISDFPQDHRYMPHKEKLFVFQSLRQHLYKYEQRRKSKLPFRAMFSSMGVWVFVFNYVTFTFAYYLFIETRQSFSEEFAKDNVMHAVNQAVVVVFPFHWMGVTTLLFGMYFYIAVKHGTFSQRTAYRLGNFISILSVLVNLPLDFHQIPSLAVLTTPAVTVLMAGFLSTSSWNHLDLAPNYCGTLIAVATLLGNIPIVVPWYWEVFVDTRMVRYATVGILSVCTMFIYMISVRADVEPWNNYVVDLMP